MGSEEVAELHCLTGPREVHVTGDLSVARGRAALPQRRQIGYPTRAHRVPEAGGERPGPARNDRTAPQPQDALPPRPVPTRHPIERLIEPAGWKVETAAGGSGQDRHRPYDRSG